MTTNLRISMIQAPILWEDRTGNLKAYEQLIKRVKGKTDLVVLPETFTTGFSMRVSAISDTMQGETVVTLKAWAEKFGVAITGSFIVEENEHFFNRAFFITPDGRVQTYDKRHLFRMGDEHSSFSAGKKQTIVNYKGWNICLQVCYDLRFPVWSRNVENAYDLLIYIANWPEARVKVWETLLPARALENLCYVCGVNRIGVDGNGLAHSGNSAVYNPKGGRIARAFSHKTMTRTCVLDKSELEKFRDKFPAWMDADAFKIQDTF